MSSIQKIKRQSGMRYKAVLKRGEQVLKTKTFTKQQLARTWLRQMEANLETIAALGLAGARTTLSDLADLYLAQYTGRDKSLKGKIEHWRRRFGSKYLPDITTEGIRQELKIFANGKALRPNGCRNTAEVKMIQSNRDRKPATVNRMKAALSTLFKLAIQDGLIKSNPVTGISNLPENNMRIRYLSSKERLDLLEATKNSEWDRLHLLVLMGICTGARKGNLLCLKWQDIDFDRREARIPRSKNGDPIILPLPVSLVEELKKFRGIGLLFPSRLKPWQPMDFKKHWETALKQSNLLYPKDHPKRFRFHDLRHTTGSYLVMNGATLYETGEILGHRCIQTTKRYAHLSVEHKKNLTDRVFGNIDHA
jgi:integrase